MRGRLLLVAIGAAFGSDERFAGRVAELRSFVAAEGHGDVPMGEPLGKWVASVRRAARGGKLDPEKRRTYAEAGGTFAPLEGRWDAAVLELRGRRLRREPDEGARQAERLGRAHAALGRGAASRG